MGVIFSVYSLDTIGPIARHGPFRESKKLACTTCHDPHEKMRGREPMRSNRQCIGLPWRW